MHAYSCNCCGMPLVGTSLVSVFLACFGNCYSFEDPIKVNTPQTIHAPRPSRAITNFLLMLKPMTPRVGMVPIASVAGLTDVRQDSRKSSRGQASRLRHALRPNRLRTRRVVAQASAVRSKHRQLPLMMTVNIVAAMIASFAISSIPIAILDAAVVRRVSGATSLYEGLMISIRQLFFEPSKFFDQGYFAVFLVYFATYLSASVADTVITLMKNDRIDTRRRDRLLKLLATSTTNIAACARKDQLFSRWFSSGPAHAVPLITTILFCFRDMLTMLATFTLPRPLEAYIRRATKTQANWVGFATNLLPVVLVQIISTPIHLSALGIYNGAPIMTVVKMNYLSSLLVRAMRAVPLAIGSIGNNMIKKEIYKLLNASVAT